MSNPFTINKTFQEGISIIHLEGYLDAHTAPQFEQSIQAELEAKRYQIVINCKNLTYISSAGLGVFMSFIEELREQGGDIKICGLTPKVKQTFDILGFSSIYDMLEDCQSAIKCFAEMPTRKDWV